MLGCFLVLALVFAAVVPGWLRDHQDEPVEYSKEGRPIRSYSQQLLWLMLVATGLPVLSCCAFVLCQDFISGTTFTPAVVYGLGRQVYRVSEPRLFWVLTVAYSVGTAGLSAACIRMIFEVAAAERDRPGGFAGRVFLWGASGAYFALLSAGILHLFFKLT